MARRVVITGIGPYINSGKGRENLWQTVCNQTPLMQPIPASFEKKSVLKSRFYIPFPPVTFEETGLHPKYRQLTDKTSCLSIICAKLALEDAGYSMSENGDIPFYNNDFTQAAVILGIGICNLKKSFEAFAANTIESSMLNDLQLNTHFNRMVVPMMMPNSASSWISILFGMQGANYTINTACSSGNYAIGEGYRKIKDGYNDIVLAGGIENFEDSTGTIMRGFDALGTLTRSEDGTPMPFSKSRSGFLFSEGAGAILVLEEYERAIKRNAPIYAEISGFECNSDANNIVLMDEKGTNISQIITKLSNNRTIDYINTHGTATQLNDLVESTLIQIIFGDKEHQPIINSTKGILGHSIGSSAALEAAVTALSIKNCMIHKNISTDNMENLNLADTNISMEIKAALSLSYGFGGHNSGLLLTKCKH